MPGKPKENNKRKWRTKKVLFNLPLKIKLPKTQYSAYFSSWNDDCLTFCLLCTLWWSPPESLHPFPLRGGQQSQIHRRGPSFFNSIKLIFIFLAIMDLIAKGLDQQWTYNTIKANETQEQVKTFLSSEKESFYLTPCFSNMRKYIPVLLWSYLSGG